VIFVFDGKSRNWRRPLAKLNSARENVLRRKWNESKAKRR